MKNLDFSTALLLIKQGYCLTRESWLNGKCVELVNGNYAIDISQNNKISYMDESMFDKSDFGTVTGTPHFRVTENKITTEGWTPTADDMLGNNWLVC